MPSFLALLLAVTMVIAISPVSANGDNDGSPDFSSFGDGKPCPGLRCSAGHSPVQKSRSKFVSKGCGKMGGGIMMGMGGGAGGGSEPYAACCDRWHACYQTCGAPKLACDEAFKTCSASACGADGECRRGYEMNSMLLNLGGCQMYDQGQYGACECVPKGGREEKRAAALRSFYKKFAADGLDKVDALAKKADSTAKLSVLFRKLHVKYPESIKVVVDDEMARMEEMMNRSKGDEKDDTSQEEAAEEDADDGDTEEL